MSIKYPLTICLVGIAVCSNLFSQSAPAKPAAEEKAEAGNVITDGVEPGKFTHDYDAAVAYAKEKKLPIFLVFTGSDWCGWCKIMDKNIFSKPEWADFAKDNLVMIWLDFPRDKSKVPEKYHERNDQLKDAFGIRGFPTYWLLDWDGRKLDRLGSGRDKTPASFQAEVEDVLKGTAANIEKLCATYKPEDATRIRATLETLKKAQAAKDKAMERVAKLQQEVEKLQKESSEEFGTASEAFKLAMEQGKIGVMTPETLEKYKAAKTALTTAQKALADWMKANRRKRPTPELNKRYTELNKAVADAQKGVDAF